jgi:hypothetical protein
LILVEERNRIIGIPFDIGSEIKIEDQYQSLKNQKRRDWFSDHAYLCLPLVIGNQYGFVVPSAHDFTVHWNGGNNPSDTSVTIDGDGDPKGQYINSHFGLGIVTVQNHFTLRTHPGVNLMTVNPPNYFIDGLQHMSGVVETDNLRRDFTFNIKITRPNHYIEVKKGQWIGCVLPIPRYFVDDFEIMDARNYMTRGQILEEVQCSKDFGRERQEEDPKKPHAAGRRYFNGEDVYGNKFPDHQKRL